MTGYTVHTGASKKFVSGWDRIFADSDSEKTPAASKPKKSRTRKSAGKKKKKNS